VPELEKVQSSFTNRKVDLVILPYDVQQYMQAVATGQKAIEAFD
jgi:hypothetical protein